MNSESFVSLSKDTKQRLTVLFDQLIPLVNSMADTLRAVLVVAFMFFVWIAVWLLYLKHYPYVFCFSFLFLALLPILVLLRFWWSLEELKDLPGILDDMVSDTKLEVKTSLLEFKSGKKSILGFFGASKSLWSIGSLVREIRELAGSYISIATLMNPIMLFLGIFSLLAVGGMGLLSVIIVFFV